MRCFSYLNQFKLNWFSYLKKSALDSIKANVNSVFRVVLIIKIVSTICVSCTTQNNTSFSSPDKAISEYQRFAQKLTEINQSDTNELVAYICNWQELSDSVFSCISRDPSFDAHFHLTAEFLSTSDSIRANIQRLACSQDRSLKDILYIKNKTNPYRNDTSILKIKNEANTFYEQSCKKMTQPSTSEDAISAYRDFLFEEVQKDISTMHDFFRFIILEDMYFRGFLKNLSDYGSISLSEITSNTETICKKIYEAVSYEKLKPHEVVIYMAIRANNRLLLNARTCIDDIKCGKIKEHEQLAAYQWMIIQPFLSIDGFSVALLTESQINELERIANEFSVLRHQLESGNANTIIQCNELTQQILKIYISSL